MDGNKKKIKSGGKKLKDVVSKKIDMRSLSQLSIKLKNLKEKSSSKEIAEIHSGTGSNTSKGSETLTDRPALVSQHSIIKDSTSRTKLKRKTSELIYNPPSVHFVANDIRVDIKEGSVNHELMTMIGKKSRLFLRRHPLQETRFDVLDEDGNRLFRLDNFSDGKTLSYSLYSAQTSRELVVFEGKMGFLSLNGEIVARYPTYEEQLPTNRNNLLELGFGSIFQETNCGSLTPNCTVNDHKGRPLYSVIDTTSSNIFWPGRRWIPSHYEFRRYETRLGVQGKIEERRLLYDSASRLKPGFKEGRRSLLAGDKNLVKVSHPQTNRLSIISMEQLGFSKGIRRYSKILQTRQSNPLEMAEGTLTTPTRTHLGMELGGMRFGSGGSGRSSPTPVVSTESIKEFSEKTTHDHFCVSFYPDFDFRLKLLFVGAHLLVNDELVRRKKARFCCMTTCTTIILTLGVVIVLLLVLYVCGTIKVK